MQKQVMEIAICTSDNLVANGIEKQCHENSVLSKLKYHINRFENGNDLLYSAIIVNVLFLEIEHLDINGLEIAECIRRRSRCSEIILLCDHAGWAKEGYKVRAWRYLVKPWSRQEFEESLETALEQLLGHCIILADENKHLWKITAEQIYAVECLGDSTCIYLEKDNVICKKNLSYWDKELEGFLHRCHKSYLVNFNYIYKIADNTILMQNGVAIPISIRKHRDILNKFMIAYSTV